MLLGEAVKSDPSPRALLFAPTFLCLSAAVGLHLLLFGAQESIAALSNQASYTLSLGLVATGLVLGVVALFPREELA